MERSNELRRKIKNKDKASLQEDFRTLRKRIDPMLETIDSLATIIFIEQVQDYILEEAE